MPSPIGHGLAGITAGWAIARPARSRGALFVQASILAATAIAPDLDLLIASHRGESHSIGAAAIAATIATLMRWPVASSRSRIWWAIFAAWATHPLLDAFALDTAAPIGIMAFWPFSSVYVQTGLEIFAPISRSWQKPGFLRQTLLACLREILILTPICLGVWFRRRARTDRG